jgi:hypothetical protein
MKQVLTLFLGIYLAAASILPAAIWEECVKLPQLWEHYQLHRESAPDLTLIDFISLHYGAESPKHQNQHDHSQIPFKAPHHSLCVSWHLAFIPLPIITPLLLALPTFLLLHRPLVNYDGTTLAERAFSFFHPPKML